MNLLQTFTSRQSQFFLALWQHLQLTFFAVLIAAVIAIPLAIWAHRHRRFAEILHQTTSIVQTLPSLAVLGLLIPLVGIGWQPALIALIIYALLPIFQNTFLGLTQIPKDVIEGAQALGLRQNQILRKIELPLAKESIIAGIRTSTVLMIGTATLAALIGAGGLGDFILLGINRNDNNLIVIGALASAILAIVAGFVINVTGNSRFWKSGLALTTILMIGGTVGPSLVPKSPQETITIAGKLGSEPSILIHMYADLIKQADPKINVTLKDNFGTTTFLYQALTSDKIDIYPEFTGTVNETLAKPAVKLPVGADAKTTYAAAKKAMAAQKLTLLKPLKYNNTYAIAVTKKDADKYHLTTIGDLANLPNAKAGMTAEFLDRPDGMPGVEKAYGFHVNAVSLDPELRYQAINQGQTNIVDAYATDSQLAQYHLVLLQDTQHFFPVYQGAPLMRSDFAKQHPKIVTALNRLAGKISDTDMQKMNYQVNVQHMDAGSVAKNYLKTHHLLP